MSTDEIGAWFRGRLDDAWFTAVDVVGDKDEILLVGTLAAPPAPTGSGEPDVDDRRVAAAARMHGFREDTRERRMAIAAEAERRFGRKVSWAVRCDGFEQRFTVANVPVMTRLLIDERRVLDTLIAAGIARSRSEALAWCVKLVGTNEADWIDRLREAMSAVEEVRAEGPRSGGAGPT
jgi:hypothetical protein